MFRVLSNLVLVFVILISFECSSFGQEEGFRTWNDNTQSFSVIAKSIGFNGANVYLLKEDGQKIEVPIFKLSKKDQEFLAANEKPVESVKLSSVLTPIQIRSALVNIKELSLDNVMFLRIQILESLVQQMKQAQDSNTLAAHEKTIRQLIGCFKLSDVAMGKLDKPNDYEIKQFRNSLYPAYKNAEAAFRADYGRIATLSRALPEFSEYWAGAKLEELDVRTSSEVAAAAAAERARIAAERARQRRLSASDTFKLALSMMENAGSDVGLYLNMKQIAEEAAANASVSERIEIGLYAQERLKQRNQGN